MGRLITLAVAVASILLIWKGGVLNGVLPQPAPPPLDPGPVISKSGDAMQALKSVHLSLNGILVLNGVAGVKLEVWIAASDSLMHQMKIDMTTTQFTWTLTYHFSNFVTGGGSSST